MDEFKKIPIIKIRGNAAEEVPDLIAVETRISIAVNGKNVLSLYCTPSMVRELVVGLVHVEGLIAGGWCAERMSIVYGDEIKIDIPATGKVPWKGGCSPRARWPAPPRRSGPHSSPAGPWQNCSGERRRRWIGPSAIAQSRSP